MVQHHIEYHADIPFTRLGDQSIEVRQCAVLGIDGLIVGDVITEVDLRRRVHGRDPDSIHAEVLEVVQALRDAVQIADAVAVRVLETARINLVNDGIVPPGRTCRGLLR